MVKVLAEAEKEHFAGAKELEQWMKNTWSEKGGQYESFSKSAARISYYSERDSVSKRYTISSVSNVNKIILFTGIKFRARFLPIKNHTLCRWLIVLVSTFASLFTAMLSHFGSRKSEKSINRVSSQDKNHPFLPDSQRCLFC